MPPLKPPDPLFAAWVLPEPYAQALAYVRPDLRDGPFVVIEQHEAQRKTRVISVSPLAADLGLWHGMPLFQVRRRFPQVIALARDLAAEAALKLRLEQWLQGMTPEAQVFPGRMLADLTGTPLARRHAVSPERRPMQVTQEPRIHAPQAGLAAPRQIASWNPDWAATQAGASHPWQSLALHLRQDAIALGLSQVGVGLGSTRLIAQVLARLMQTGGARACLPGEEAATLAPLSPQCLPGLSPSARELLTKLQLHRLDHVAALGCPGLVARFGREGEALHRMACGLDLEIASPRRREWKAETVLSKDECDEDQIRNTVRLTVDKMAFVLQDAGVAADRIHVGLVYGDGRENGRTLTLSRPTASFSELVKPVLAAFTAMHQRRVALSRIRLRVAAPKAATGQTDLFDDSSALRQQALGEAITRIRRKRGFETIVSAANVNLCKDVQ